MGYDAIKTKYWENGISEVEAYFRRKTIEGEWIWLVSKFISIMEEPVPALVIRESVVLDTELALSISRAIRVGVLLINATETAELLVKSQAMEMNQTKSLFTENGGMNVDIIPGLADDAAALQMILAAANKGNDTNTNNVNQLQQLMEVASQGGGGNNNGNNNEKQHLSSDAAASTEPLSMLEKVRSGAIMDLTKVKMDRAEIKLVTLVLTGRLATDEIAPLLIMSFHEGKDLQTALSKYQTEREWQIVKDEASARSKTRSYRRHHSDTIHHHAQHHRHASFSKKRLNSISFMKNFDFTAQSDDESGNTGANMKPPPALPPPSNKAPSISVLNLAFTNLGNQSLEMLCEVISANTPSLKTIDVSFTSIDEKGFLGFCRAVRKRRKNNLAELQGLILSGNAISYKAAKELGSAFSSNPDNTKRSFRKRPGRIPQSGGYEVEDDEEDDDDFDDFYDEKLNRIRNKKSEDTNKSSSKSSTTQSKSVNNGGLMLLHLACTSLTADSLSELLIGLGQSCPLRELNLSSNNLGSSGANALVQFLEGKSIRKLKRGQSVMPKLNRIDLSNNDLGNEGTAKLTRAISKRVSAKIDLVNLKLSYNGIEALGIETIMNKLLQHNLSSLSLDNNNISDRGCQLVAASLPSMHHLSRLSLSFNQIGSRGITALMRALVGCESMTFLGVSGNVMKISGAIAMGFALAQHPRLEELEADNCCLSQVAQCHIVAGIISNRWVPMKKLNGFKVGPPMVAIGALDMSTQNFSNEECFRIRRDTQMKNILQWMQHERNQFQTEEVSPDQFLTPDLISTFNEVNGVPSQSAYLRMLDWLSKLPFDEDELNDLRRYFFDPDGADGDGMRGSDGQINLKDRGDLLAALGSKVAEEIRDADSVHNFKYIKNCRIGLTLDEEEVIQPKFSSEVWNGLKKVRELQRNPEKYHHQCTFSDGSDNDNNSESTILGKKRKSREELLHGSSSSTKQGSSSDLPMNSVTAQISSCASSLSQKSAGSRVSDAGSVNSNDSRHRSRNKVRIVMFPPFAAKLELLKAQAQEMMDMEQDPYQQDIIAQQFAEASLTLLRQLRYHCMNNGLDGWRQGKIRRKVLIVDDSKVTRKLVARAFEKANFIVDTAENGQEGVAKLKQCIYDIAFMDIDMPVMNGFDATKALRDWEDKERPGARQPICALTAAYVDDFERSELMKFKEAGLDVMESKPCNIPRLLKVVDDVSPMFSDLSINVSHLDQSIQ